MKYDSPFIKTLETLANMAIVSFLWLLFSLPVVTVIASSAALFHTVNKIIFGPGKGNGVLKDFFASYKENLVPGIKLTLLLILCSLIIAEGLWTGYQFYQTTLWGLAYFILGIVIAFVFVTMLIHVAPVLSRFEAPTLSIIRMAIYFAIRKPFRSILFCLFFLLIVYCVQVFPLALLIVPAFYTDLIRGPLDKDFHAFAQENGLEEETEDTAEEEPEDVEENTEENNTDEDVSIIDLEERFNKERK